ncbi:hypothetical protein JOQ06_010866, partial [Pogonophryne albipinna]
MSCRADCTETQGDMSPALCHHAINPGQPAVLTLFSDSSERLSIAAASASPLRKSTLRAGQHGVQSAGSARSEGGPAAARRMLQRHREERKRRGLTLAARGEAF